MWDCTNGVLLLHARGEPRRRELEATGGAATNNPNEFSLLDLTPLVAHAGGYVNPITGNSDLGPYPADMTERDAVRGPGYWNIDFGLSKRVRFGRGRCSSGSRPTTCSTTPTCSPTRTRPT